MSSWTRAGLAGFVGFITNFYNGDGMHVAKQLRAHGVKIPREDGYHGKLLKLTASWWPKDDDQQYAITDMGAFFVCRARLFARCVCLSIASLFFARIRCMRLHSFFQPAHFFFFSRTQRCTTRLRT